MIKQHVTLATWLSTAQRHFGPMSSFEVTLHTSNLVDPNCDFFENFPRPVRLNEAYEIVAAAQLQGDRALLAAAVLRGCNEQQPTTEEIRKCSSCRKVKPVTQFHKHQKYCRACKQYYNWFTR